MEYNIFVNDKHIKYLVQMDGLDINMLAISVAASVIESCKENPDVTQRMEKGAIGIISDRSPHSADHFLVNILVHQVSFLYSLVETKVKAVKEPKNEALFLLFESSPKIVTDALEAFQEWKTKYCKYKEEKFGEGYGTATRFNMRDWTDLNEELYALLS